jgi:hypothetical protein
MLSLPRDFLFLSLSLFVSVLFICLFSFNSLLSLSLSQR